MKISPTRLSSLLAATGMALALLLAPGPSGAQALRVVTLVKGLDHPWSVAFLPGFEEHGRALVTERIGRLRIVTAAGRVGPPIEGVPKVVAGGQGGLMDVVLDPRFAENQLVYLSYSEAGDGGSGTAVARGRLEGTRLVNVQVIFRQRPKVGGNAHFGSRLVFARDGRLFVTLGDRFSRRDDAQKLDNHLGKVVRIEADGRVPADNPLAGENARPGTLPEIWSWGHRNVQGAALHPVTGELWTHEHGPQGGDEVNVTLAGRNYGWPVITHGREYGTGMKIGEGTAKAGVEPPVSVWVPSIAPSGMAFLGSDRYPGWKGSLFVGALRAETLVRLELDGRKVLREERLLTNKFERIREVRQGPDGWLYLLTDSADGRLLRLER